MDCGPNSGVSLAPVDVSYGDKYESMIDLTVPCTGPDLVLSRSYTSKGDYGGAGLVGANWTISPIFDFAIYDSANSTIKGYCGTPPSTYGMRPFEYDGSSKWTDGGWSTQHMLETTLTIGSTVYDVWRFVEPGQWDRDFYHYDASGTPALDASYNGLLLQERDMYGNVRTYEYDDTLFTEPRLQRILLFSTSRSTTDPEAEVWFSWVTETAPGNVGRLAGIQVVRNFGTTSAPEMLVTNQVEYRYKGGSDGLSADLGTTGDLIEVRQRERVDRTSASDPLWRERITLYRYHDESQSSLSDERLNVTGGDHQLKGIIMPEQVEFMAEQMTWSGSDPLTDRVALAAESTLAKDDDDVAFTDAESNDILIVDLAAKWIGYQTVSSTSVVKDQYLQSSCGCGGTATQGTRLRYTFYWYTNDRTLKIAQTTHNGSAYSTTFRNEYYDTTLLTSSINSAVKIPYVVTHAIEDAAAQTGYWVRHWEHDTPSHRIIREMMPSAMDSYTPGTSSAASYTAKTGAGLVYAYTYDSNNRRTSIRVRQGQDSSDSNFTKIAQTTYSTSTGHEYLPTTIERFRVAGSSSANDIETTSLDYGFHSGSSTAIAWIKQSVERELESENGPSGTGTYDSYELFDAAGDNVWSRDAANSLAYREFETDGGTGTLTLRTRNAANTALDGGDFGGLTVTGWGNSASGGSLTTTYTRDGLGRMTSREEPGGATRYTRRYMAENSDRSGILYYREVDLPHDFGSGTPRYDGPATVTYFNAADAPFVRADYEVSTSGYDPLDEDYPTFTLSTQRSKSLTIHRLSGLVEASRQWPRIEDDPSTYDETVYEYDALGRVQYMTNPNGTVTSNAAYDVQHRVLEVKVGTDPAASGNMKTVARYYYDHTGSDSSPAQGYGDGNLTLSFLHTGETSGGSEITRKTKRFYDFRNRLIEVQNPEVPHEYLTYDNLDRVAERALFSADPSAIDDPIASRGLYVKSFYSQRGLSYKESVATDPTSSSPSFLESHRWYDAEGRIVAEWRPNSPGVKHALDGLGRPTTISVNDRLDDAAPGTSGNYADAISLAKNYVLEQTVYRYNSAGLTDLVTLKRRRALLTSLSTLGSSDAVSTYTGYFYDAADRLIRTASFGTNDSGDQFITGTSAPTWPPSTPPDWDTTGYENVIITATGHDAIGRVNLVTDPEGKKTAYVYDSLSRRVAVAENYVNAAVTWSSADGGFYDVSGMGGGTLNDQDRVTTYLYDGIGNVTRQSAWQTGSVENQQTEYTYLVTAGTGDGDSRLNSNDLLSQVQYPDESDGTPGSTDAYKVNYRYNVLGELRRVTDQNETVHTYTRDGAGRVTSDAAVIDSGSPIDDTIDKIAATFDSLGRLQYVRSYDGSTIKNALEMTYTPLWQIRRVYQDSDGDITRSGDTPTGTTVVATYGYSDAAVASGNYSRLATLTYPTNASGGDDGRGVLYYDYGSGTVDSRITRVATLKIPAPTGGNPSAKASLATYTYLGMDMIAGVDYPVPDVQLDRTVGSEGKRRLYGYTTQTTGLYPGYDRFGRVKAQEWVDGALTTHATDTDVPNIPPIVQLEYSYDNSSNRLSRLDKRPGATQQARDFEHTYDGLDRLVTSRRGVSGGGAAQSSSTLNASQKWSLDMLGNWNSVYFDSDASGTFTSGSPDEEEVRTHNQANEIEDREPDGASPPTLPFTYDAAGNLAEKARSTSATDVLTHDPWNRLVKVETRVSSTTSPLAEYEYNGLHWRTVKRSDTTLPADGVLDEKREMHYSANWQLLEERIDADYVSNAGVNAISQQFWGTRYIDDAVAKRIDRRGSGGLGDPDGDFADSDDEAYFYLTDAQFSVVAILDSGANLRERLSYDAYGHARHHWGADVDGDGDVDSTDAGLGTNGAGIGTGTYNVDADYNRSGTTNSTDIADATLLFGTSEGALSPYGRLNGDATGLVNNNPVTVYSTDNSVGYCGYLFNAQTLLYTVRFRHYDPKQGRWLERDPAGYVDGMSLYQFLTGAPTSRVDPTGLVSVPPDQVPPLGRVGPGQMCCQQQAPNPCTSMHEIEVDVLSGHGGFALSVAGILTVGESQANTVDELVAAIRKQIKDAEFERGTGCVCIKQLRIIGHGTEGAIDTADPSEGGTIETFDKYWLTSTNTDVLKQFAPYMCKGSKVVIRSCNSAQGYGGYRFLRDISNATGVPATGYGSVTLSIGNLCGAGQITVEPGAPSDCPPGWPGTGSGPLEWLRNLPKKRFFHNLNPFVPDIP